MSRDTARVVNGYALESMALAVSYETFVQIATSIQKLEGRIGRKEFEVTPEDRVALRKFAIEINPNIK